jgi:hypothetical protein
MRRRKRIEKCWGRSGKKSARKIFDDELDSGIDCGMFRLEAAKSQLKSNDDKVF